jgi:MinD-like ATPase involved in chromosome partitioning or flagellar assembly
MGRPARVFARNVKTRKEDPDRPGYVLVPEPNAQELAARQEEAFQDLIGRSKAELLELTQLRQRSKIAFVNPVGKGGKSTSTIWAATSLRLETNCGITVVDGNFAAGVCAERLFMDGGRTITERAIIDNYGTFKDHGDFLDVVRHNADGVYVIEARSLLEGGRKLNADQYHRLVQFAHVNSSFVYVDTMNDITGDQGQALVDEADVIVFATNVAEQDSLRKLGLSMESLRNYGFRDKVNNAVVLVNNLPPGDEAINYEMYQHEIDVNDRIVRHVSGFNGQFVGVHHDLAIFKAKPVRYSDLLRETAQDWRQVNIAILKQLPLKKQLKESKRSVHPAFQPQVSSDLTER